MSFSPSSTSKRLKKLTPIKTLPIVQFYSSPRKVIILTPKSKTKRLFTDYEFENKDTFTHPNSPNDNLFHLVCKMLDNAGCLNDFITFLHLVNKDKFSLDNISFLLFLDTARFLGLSNLSQMTYPHQTKHFWKAGKKLLHNKFIYFMGGPNHFGQQSQDLKPDNARINFAVPSISVLNESDNGSLEILF